MRVKLTPAFCKNVTAEPGKDRSLYWDSVMPGFGLMVTTSKHKSYVIQYRNGGGASRRFTLSADALTLDEARREARKRLGDIERGADPVGDRRRERAAAEANTTGTLEYIFNQYLKRESGLRSIAERRAVFERAILPVLGNRPIADIKRSEIVKLLDQIEDERGPVAAQKALQFLSVLFNWYAARSDDFRSPIVRGMARASKQERARKRILTDDEIRSLWKATEAPGPYPSLARFLLLTGARRNEAARAPWEEITDGVWTIPATRTKQNAEVEIPLSKMALDVLAAIPKMGRYIFSSTGAKPVSGFGHGKKDLDQASGVTGWTFHDLRRTARSLMSRVGIQPDVAERCLGHTVGGLVQQTYDRHRYLEEKREAFEKLARLITKITRG
jgi:integrase